MYLGMWNVYENVEGRASRRPACLTTTPSRAGVYLCVRAYGTANLTYALRASQSLCPADFTADGRRMECSSLVGAPEEDKRATGCNADGTCACKPPYQQPVANVYDGARSSLPSVLL